MAERMTIKPDVDFIQRVQKAGGETLKQCYQCSTCSTVCEMSPAVKPFPRKEMLWAQWGMKDKLVSDPDIWLCHQCNDCSVQCPRGARPGDVLAAIRSYIYESFTFPRFMGRLNASPAGLPILFLIPILIVIGVIFFGMAQTGHDFAYYFSNAGGEVELTEFIPAGITEILFVVGNILIFAIAAIGLKRFWNQLNHEAAGPVKMGFSSALMETFMAILTHRHFATCGQNKPRQIAHLLVFYGFFGAAATAGLSLLFGHLLHSWYPAFAVEPPINLPSPIKILGAASGIMIFIGSTMMLVRRNNRSDDVGADGFMDRFFLWMIFLVGFTGMTSWLLRWADTAALAYTSYFIHIVVVFVLLWYMPYSKFAHMLYRTLALVWAKQRGREIASAEVAPVPQDEEQPVATAS